MPITPVKPSTGGVATTSLPWSSITAKPSFATVATSGAYADLANKPTTIAAAGLTDAASMNWCMSNFLTSSSLAPYATTSSMTSALSGYATTANLSSYATTASLSGYASNSALSGKFNTPTGTASQYIRGDGSLAAFPVLFDGTYSALTGKPTLFDGTWSSVTGKPLFTTVATSGSYLDLSDKPTITAFAVGVPVARGALSLGTAYQASVSSKPTLVTLNLTSTSSISLSGTSNNEGAIWIGATSAVATGTGTRLSEYKNSLGGALVVGLTVTTSQTQPYSFVLPVGWYYAIRQTVGTGLTVVSLFEQPLT